jgi:peptidoglycan hydrolase-like protein with peptidoglycan-binding domain
VVATVATGTGRSPRRSEEPAAPSPSEAAVVPSTPEAAVVPPPPETAVVPPPPEAMKDPSNRTDAMWIQTKLHDLGYYAGNANGIFGPASHSALRDFKSMNGLQDDDKWDKESERLLSSKQSIRASSTFIGSWAKDTGACQSVQGSAPLVIRSRGAEAAVGKCDFRSVKREAVATWRVQAACTADKQEWTANISLKLTGSNLNWSSERGNETYVRCPKS